MYSLTFYLNSIIAYNTLQVFHLQLIANIHIEIACAFTFQWHLKIR